MVKTLKKFDSKDVSSLILPLVTSLGDMNHNPLGTRELMEKLAIPKAQVRAVEKQLEKLRKIGVLTKINGKKYCLSKNSNLRVGCISFTRRGIAYVKELNSEREFFIPPKKSGTALGDDIVLIRINVRNRDRTRSGLRNSGEVVQVLKRKYSIVVGTLKRFRNSYCVIPLRSNMPKKIHIRDLQSANIGERVTVQLLDSQTSEGKPEGKIIKVIGLASDPSLDTIAVITSHNLRAQFPDHVLKEAQKFTPDFPGIESREDFRKKLVFTIDPESARDFDDAISLDRIPGGNWLLGVHIADVGHFVPIGSAIDREAQKRGTSVYFPDRVIPMLPEALSNGLCSLKEKEDRLTLSVLITMDGEGNPIRARFSESLICSRHRLTYGQVQEVLHTPDGSAFPRKNLGKRVVAKLKQLNTLTQKIRDRRFRNGSLKMEIPEVQVELGKDGRISRISPVVHNEAHQLVEESMLLANEMVCKELKRRKIPHLYRIHEEPDPIKIGELEELLFVAGFKVCNLSDRKNMCRFLDEVSALPQAHAWNTAVLRSLKRAEYSSTPMGHFGLAKDHYTHFTSPIRRYPDLVVHRILKSELRKSRPLYNLRDLSEIAAECTEKEQAATEAERDHLDLKILRFFFNQIETGNLKAYEAIVVDVRKKGALVNLPVVQAFGMIPLSMFKNDFFDYNKNKKEIKGRKTGVRVKIGTCLKVMIANVNIDKRQLDFIPYDWIV